MSTPVPDPALCLVLQVHDDGATTDVLNMGTYANVYWAFGGGHRQLVRFDFESDHGPGVQRLASWPANLHATRPSPC